MYYAPYPYELNTFGFSMLQPQFSCLAYLSDCLLMSSFSLSVLSPLLLFFSGTGSTPPLQKGLHRNIRQMARNIPRKNPRFSIASIAYSEHVGTKRQLGLNLSGDI